MAARKRMMVHAGPDCARRRGPAMGAGLRSETQMQVSDWGAWGQNLQIGGRGVAGTRARKCGAGPIKIAGANGPPLNTPRAPPPPSAAVEPPGLDGPRLRAARNATSAAAAAAAAYLSGAISGARAPAAHRQARRYPAASGREKLPWSPAQTQTGGAEKAGERA